MQLEIDGREVTVTFREDAKVRLEDAFKSLSEEERATLSDADIRELIRRETLIIK